MSVNDGQNANDTTFNAAFMSRNSDTNTTGQVDLENVDAPSGASIANIQRFLNSVASALGIATDEVFDYIHTFATAEGFTAIETLIERIETLSALFDKDTGHTHDGTDGKGGAIIDASVGTRGLMSDGAFPQSLSGDKIWLGLQWVQNDFSFDSQNHDAAGVNSGDTLTASGKVLNCITGTGPVELRSMDAIQTDGAIYMLQNRSDDILTIFHDDAGHTAANRFYCPNDGDLEVAVNGLVMVMYDDNAERWIVLSYSNGTGGSGGSVAISGTRASPTAIVAGSGITASADMDQLHFIEGSGGAVTVSANPQISAGSTVGQALKLQGRSDTNTVTLSNGTGLSLNGDIIIGEDDVIQLHWDGTNWCEDYRRR